MSRRLERLIAMEALIRAGGYPNAEQMCRLFEAQPRTIFEDIKVLRKSFGLDIRYDRGRNGYYNASPENRLPPITPDDESALLFLVATELLCKIGGDSFRGKLAAAVDRLSIENVDMALTGKLADKIEFHGNLPPVSVSTFILVLRAMVDEQPITIRVHQSSDKIIRVVPTKLALTKEGWHMQGNGGGTLQMSLALSRVELVE